MDLIKLLIVCLLLACFASLINGDEVTFQRDGQTVTVTGKILVEAEDGGLLFQEQSGRLRIFQKDEFDSKVVGDKEVPPFSSKQIKEQLLKELPDGFKVHTTRNFVVAYNTERTYAKWIGGIYERLFKGFLSHWSRRKLKLNAKPSFPLVAIIFKNREEYARYVQAELGQQPGNMVAYYNLITNRVAMYDLTSGLVPAGAKLDDNRRITEILGAPNALDMVATVIHEGTHQLMFNTGMQTRMSDTPLWINEGLAMYFETPDMNNSRGWRAIGQVNGPRLRQFRQEFNTRPAGAFKSMLSSDDRFKNPNSAAYAYAEAWSFNYFLLKKHSDKYVEYLKHMSEKSPLEYLTPEARLKEFQSYFGDDLSGLESEFLTFIRNLK